MFMRKSRLMKHKGKVDAATAAHLKKLRIYDRRRMVVPPIKSYFHANLFTTMSLLTAATMAGAVSYAALPRIAPLALVKWFDPQLAEEWNNARSDGCMPELLEWRLAGILMVERSPAGLLECYKFRQRRKA